MTNDHTPGAAPTPPDRAHPPIASPADAASVEAPRSRWVKAGVGAVALAVASLIGVSAAQAQTDDPGSSDATTEDDTDAPKRAPNDGSESPDARGDREDCPEGEGGPSGERPGGDDSSGSDSPSTPDTTEDTSS